MQIQPHGPVRPERRSEQAAWAAAHVFGGVLERLQADLVAAYGDSAITLRPDRFDDRPFTHLLRVRVDSTSSEVPAHLFVKRHKTGDTEGDHERIRRRVEHEGAITRLVYDAMRQFRDIAAVQPVACYPDELTLVTVESKGQTLLCHLERHAKWFPSGGAIESLEQTMRAVGRWIGVMQTVQEPGGTAALSDIRDYIDVRLRRLIATPLARFTCNDRERVLGHIADLSASVPPEDLKNVLIHADLAVGNVLVDDARVVVLDFAMSSSGTRLHDLTRMFLQLDLLCAKPQFRRTVVNRLQTALLRGFDRDMTTSHPLFRLLLLLHRVNHFTTLSVRPARFPGRLYDAHVRAIHRRSLSDAVALHGAVR
jgi:hypothetical protein